jgi:hypothetical protein
MSDGWRQRSRTGGDGHRIDYLERDSGSGIVTRIYDPDNAELRTAGGPQPIYATTNSSDPRPLAEPPRRVVISEAVRDTILSTATWDGALEQGWGLFGHVSDGGVEIVRAVECGSNRTPVRVELNLANRGGQLDDLVLCGDAHIQPGSDPLPSTIDARGWERCFRSARGEGSPLPFWVGLISSAPKYGTPQLNVYVCNLAGYRLASS